MEVFRDYVTKQLPAYLKGLPIPASIDGFATLSQDELVAIAPLFLLIASMFVMIVLHLFPEKASRINKSIRLGEAKVVDSVTRKEIAAEEKETIAYCRCWQSKKVRLALILVSIA